jgi:hypothetical protein
MYVFLLEIFGVVGLSFASLRRPIATVALKRLQIKRNSFFQGSSDLLTLYRVSVMVINSTVNNILVISWR